MQKKLLVLFLVMSITLGACSQHDGLNTTEEMLSQVYDATKPMITKVFSGESDRSQPSLSEVNQEIRVTQKSIMDESDDPRYEIQITYPYLGGDSGLVSSFNTELESQVLQAREQFLSEVSEREAAHADDGMPTTSSLLISYELTYASNQLFSVHLLTTTYLAVSAHPFTTSISYNYDAQKGHFLILKDLFLPETDFHEMISGRIESALSVRDFGYQAGTAENVLFSRENWNILSEGLRINFDAYEVGPGAAGPQFVLIPWEDLSTILKRDGPIRQIPLE